jgi:AraC-like DNA-binding protein
VWHLDVSDTTAINDLIRNRPKIRRQRAPVGIGPDELMLVEILWVLAGSPDDVPGNGPQPLSADHLTRWIETHFSDAFDLDRMAGDFGVSRGTLCRAVRQHFQASPLQLVQHRRVEEAKRLLRIPGATVSAVASALGYGHPRPFRDLYRRQTGRSPSDDLVPRALEQRGW